MTRIQNVVVVGGGLMGAGIAQVFAAANYKVTVFEPSEEARASLSQRVAANLGLMGADESIADRIQTRGDLAEAVADAHYVTEAAPEKLELKRSIFADLERLAPHDAILASNTSVIPITPYHRRLGQRPPHGRDPLVESALPGAPSRGYSVRADSD